MFVIYFNLIHLPVPKEKGIDRWTDKLIDGQGCDLTRVSFIPFELSTFLSCAYSGTLFIMWYWDTSFKMLVFITHFHYQDNLITIYTLHSHESRNIKHIFHLFTPTHTHGGLIIFHNIAEFLLVTVRKL